MSEKSETKRLNVYTTKEIAENLAVIAKEYGVSASSLASLAIGQYVKGMMKQREMLYGQDGMMEAMVNHLKEHITRQLAEQKGEGV
jgi:hypothetical protein